MIVLWPPPKDDSEQGLLILCRQAIQSALDIQARLNDKNVVDDIKLSVKIGFGIGDITILHVGGKFGRAEYLAAGEPLLQAFEAEHCAKSGGQVFVSREVLEKVSKYFNYVKVKELFNGEF
jgi:class 3 adenylate cyclase